MNGETTPRTIHELLVRQADVCGRAPAIVVHDGPTLTYGELLCEVEQTVAALAAAGIGHGTRVAMSFPNGADGLVLQLALMSGAICVPMNPALDRSSYSSSLRNLRVVSLIAPEGADTPAVDVARSLGLLLLRLVPRSDDVAGGFDLRVETTRPPVIQAWPLPDDLAIMFQTSGTTALPKAVPLTQAQVIARSRTQPIDAADRCLFVSPMYAAGAMAHTILAPIAAGGSIGFPRATGEVALLEALEGIGITYFSANPAIFISLLERLAERPSTRMTKLRFIRSAGSPLRAALQLRVEEAFGVPVIQAYGTTEAGTLTGNPLPPRSRKDGSVGISVGPEIAIANVNGAYLGPNLTGEIVVRSPGVMSGYENDADANRDAFCDGWFRTGDLGHLDKVGYLFLTGRIKEVINRGGFKVAPVEIDDVLLRHPEVSDAAAFAVRHPSLGEDVAAAVVIRSEGRITPKQLREFAFDHLAAYKVPTTIVFVAALPRNATRKIDRRTLARDLAHSMCPAFVAPRNAQETLVASIFAEVLGIDRVGADDNFFQLGGDSLRGAQVISRVNVALGSSFSVECLFQWPTVVDFSIAASADRRSRSDALPVEPPPDDLLSVAARKRPSSV